MHKMKKFIRSQVTIFRLLSVDGNKTTGLYNLPKNATVDHCYCNSETTQSMQLNWGSSVSPQIMVLQLENKNKTIALTQIKVDILLSSDDFPNAKGI